MSWILTHSGKRFDPIAPTVDMIDIDDIAHALSHVNRFNGHSHVPYSVAAHSIHVMHLVQTLAGRQATPELLLAALLHDASEAYLCDIPSPIKPHLLGYAQIEANLQQVIADSVGLDPANFSDPLIKQADLIALATEKRDIMPAHTEAWACLAGVDPDRMALWRPHAIDAAHCFVYSFQQLQAAR